MSFVPSFTINAVIPTDPSSINLIDTSVGSDVNIVSRQVILYDSKGALFNGPNTWSIANSSFSFTPLTQDIALNVVVNYLGATNNILYTSSQIFIFKNYSEQFYYTLTQAQTATPYIINDPVYVQNKSLLRLYLDDSVQAINVGQDVYAANSLILRAINMVQQHQLYFNI